jgi:hypothetical protein
MASPAANQANCANAAHSTGPRTVDGKNASSQNARKHGLCSSKVVLREGEKEIFERRHAALHAELQPTGELETIFVDQIVICDWNMGRIGEMEAVYHAAHPEAYSDVAGHRELEILRRYRVNAERNFYRAFNELRKLQTIRFLRATTPQPAPMIVKVTPPAQRAMSLEELLRSSQAARASANTENSPVRNEPISAPCPCGSGNEIDNCCSSKAQTSPGQ